MTVDQDLTQNNSKKRLEPMLWKVKAKYTHTCETLSIQNSSLESLLELHVLVDLKKKHVSFPYEDFISYFLTNISCCFSPYQVVKI